MTWESGGTEQKLDEKRQRRTHEYVVPRSIPMTTPSFAGSDDASDAAQVSKKNRATFLDRMVAQVRALFGN